MRPFPAWFGGGLLCVVLGASATGCISWETKKHVQHLKVTTEPEGVYVLRRDGQIDAAAAKAADLDMRNLGRAPAEFDVEFDTVTKHGDQACWVLPPLAAAALAAGIYTFAYGLGSDCSSSDTSCISKPRSFGLSMGAGFPLIMGGTLGAVFGTMHCVDASTGNGVTTINRKKIALKGAKEGYKSEVLNLDVPVNEKEIRLVLRPGQDDAPAQNVAVADPAASKNVSHEDVVPPGGNSPATQPGTAPGFSFVQGGPQRNAYALIIGVERHRDVPAATGARLDAERFAEIARRTLGISADHILLALDDRAAHSDIDKHVDWLKANVPRSSRVYFYFSGHGAPNPSTGEPYLVPYDGDPKAFGTTAIKLADVLKSLSETKAADVVAIVDSCFSGAGGRSVLPPGARPLVRVKDMQAPARLVLFSGATGAEISGPDKDGSGGLFSRFVADGLGKGLADINGDGDISVQELSEWVGPRVARQAKMDGRDQRPNLVIGGGVGSPRDILLAAGIATK